MYVPSANAEQRLEVLHALIRAHSLGTWVTAHGTSLEVDHIPFLLDEARGKFGTLVGHVARANPIWTVQPNGATSVIIFRGPQAYVTPSWYPSKHEHGKAVPTWNYAVVTVHGRPKFIDDREWLLSHVSRLTDLQESGEALPWRVEDAPRDFTDRLLGAIVGVEIPIDRIEGKWKTNQNRPITDKLGVAAGLEGKGDDESLAMAALVRAHAVP